MLHSFTVNLIAAALFAHTHILPTLVFCFVLPLGIASAIAKFSEESERPTKACQPVLPVGMVLLCYLGRLQRKIRPVRACITHAHSLTCIKTQSA